MLKVYTDSSYDWNKTDSLGKGTGVICVCIPEEAEIIKEKLTIEVLGLKQLNNHFELIAIQRALDIMKNRRCEDFEIYSDSKVAVGWANHEKVKWIPREQNYAGKALEEYYTWSSPPTILKSSPLRRNKPPSKLWPVKSTKNPASS